jgi:O-methyltransferase involved in polyketide biosynthesis
MQSILQETVANTMLMPLWGRAFASKLNPQILDDSEAIKTVNSLDYDFSKIENNFGEFGGICYIVRARVFDDIIKDFIKEHPNASIVNIGAGLDTTFSRIDNGSIYWHNLDLPEAIEFRKTLIPDSERNIAIPLSVFDFAWFDKIKFEPENGILFTAAGVFYYFKEHEIKQLFCAMSEQFPGGIMAFDAESNFDFVLAHTGPNSINKKVFQHEAPSMDKFFDKVADLNDTIDDMISCRQWWCGHWHRDKYYYNEHKKRGYQYLYYDTMILDESGVKINRNGNI